MKEERNMTDNTVTEAAVSEKAAVGSRDNASLLEAWIQDSPQMRSQEIEYLSSRGEHNPVVAREDGNVQQVFSIAGWTFLLVIDRTFPRETEGGGIPLKVCLVSPSLEELGNTLPRVKIPCVKKDASGVEYLAFEVFDREYEQYRNGQLDRLLSKTLLIHTRKWVEALQLEIRRRNGGRLETGRDRKGKYTADQGIRTPSFLFRKNGREVRNGYQESMAGYAKYTDGRASVTGNVSERCKKVVLSDRAYIQIYNESQARIQTETGGLLLGHFEDGVWYVVEASDPGINARFTTTYHEGDDVYENHVCSVISRTYKHPLVFLGMWHRHPGSLDHFSGTDDSTNYKYAQAAGNGCISAIINYDPEFRITFYHADQAGAGRVSYTRVDVEVGDEKFPNKSMLKIATVDDVNRRGQ